MNASHWDLLGQIIGFLAAALNVGCFLCKNRAAIVGLQIISALLWCGHFALLGATTGVAMNFLGAVRQFIFFRRGRSSWAGWSGWPLVFILIFVSAAAATWQGWISLLPLGGMIGGTIALWQLNTKRLRLLSMIPPPLWFSYNFLSGSYAGMVTEVGIFLAQIVGLVWHERKRPAKN